MSLCFYDWTSVCHSFYFLVIYQHSFAQSLFSLSVFDLKTISHERAVTRDIILHKSDKWRAPFWSFSFYFSALISTFPNVFTRHTLVLPNLLRYPELVEGLFISWWQVRPSVSAWLMTCCVAMQVINHTIIAKPHPKSQALGPWAAVSHIHHTGSGHRSVCHSRDCL